MKFETDIPAQRVNILQMAAAAMRQHPNTQIATMDGALTVAPFSQFPTPVLTRILKLETDNVFCYTELLDAKDEKTLVFPRNVKDIVAAADLAEAGRYDEIVWDTILEDMSRIPRVIPLAAGAETADPVEEEPAAEAVKPRRVVRRTKAQAEQPVADAAAEAAPAPVPAPSIDMEVFNQMAAKLEAVERTLQHVIAQNSHLADGIAAVLANIDYAAKVINANVTYIAQLSDPYAELLDLESKSPEAVLKGVPAPEVEVAEPAEEVEEPAAEEAADAQVSPPYSDEYLASLTRDEIAALGARHGITSKYRTAIISRLRQIE